MKKHVRPHPAGSTRQRPILYELALRYFQDHISSRGAALAYFLLFSMFPLCILFSLVIAQLDINPAAVTTALRPFLPHGVLMTLGNYLVYVQNSYNRSLLLFSIVFSIYFPWRAVKGLMSDIRKAFRQKDDTKSRWYFARELVCTLLIPVSILISLLLVLLGRNVIVFLVGTLSLQAMHISEVILSAWESVRFLLAALIMGLALAILYHLAPDRPLPLRQCVPGTVFAIAGWIIAGILFSYYTEHFARYSLIYGTLTAVIVLMLWLYWTGVIFVMGGELNALLAERKAAGREADAEVGEIVKSTERD